MISDEMVIKEELRWVYILYHNKGNTIWGEYLTEEEAEQAIANIRFNEESCKTKTNV